MNIRRYSFLAALMGAICFALRFMQQKTGFEAETGLARSGNLYAILLPILLLAFAAVLIFAIRPTPFAVIAAKRPFGDLFSMEEKTGAKAFAVCGILAMMAAGALEVFEAVSITRDTLSLVAGAFLVVAGVCLFLTVKALGGGEEGDGTYLLAAVCCAVVQLVASYRVYAIDPVLQGYYVELLALTAHVLAFYALAGFYFSGRGFGRFCFFTLAALVLTLTSLADRHALSELLAFLGMSGAEVGILMAAGETLFPKRGKRQA